MRVLRIVVPWIVLAGSALGFALGWSWEKKGRQYQEYYASEPELGIAISEVGNAIECVGIIGAFVGIALFLAVLQLNKFEARIRCLEAEISLLRRAFPAIQTPPKF